MIHGSGRDDVICGGAGSDALQREAGKDRLFGDKGDDRLDGGKDFDRCDSDSHNNKDQVIHCERVHTCLKFIRGDVRVRYNAPP
jgi:Ca2+-binding RTX toxin-like protein